MASQQLLTHVQSTVDPSVQFSYEATAYGFVIGSGLYSFHIIVYAGDPVGKFLNVPNGSVTIDATNHHTYTKTGLVGSGKAGAWVVNS